MGTWGNGIPLYARLLIGGGTAVGVMSVGTWVDVSPGWVFIAAISAGVLVVVLAPAPGYRMMRDVRRARRALDRYQQKSRPRRRRRCWVRKPRRRGRARYVPAPFKDSVGEVRVDPNLLRPAIRPPKAPYDELR